MARLVYFVDGEDEYVAIITHPDFAEECKENGLKEQYSVELDGDFTGWPADRLLEQL